MKMYPLSVPENEIETEAEMHAEETRNAVSRQSRHGRAHEKKGARSMPSASRDKGQRK
jgi:hypothetical protein